MVHASNISLQIINVVGENNSKESASLEHIICLNLVQKQEAKLASTRNYSDEGDRTEILDIEKHYSDEEQDGFVTERFRRGNFVNIQPEDY